MTTGSDIYGPQAPRMEDVWRAQLEHPFVRRLLATPGTG